jgi:hypothetical protein
MNAMNRWVGGLALVVSLASLAGCGSGYVESTQVAPSLFANVAFRLDMRINGVFIPDVYVEPGYQQDVPLLAGSNFEVLASGPVAWTVTIDGTVVNPPLGTGVTFNGVSLVPTSISSGKFSAVASAQGFLPQAREISIIATSLVDSRQEANINILLTK